MNFTGEISYNGWTAARATAAGGRPSSGWVVKSVRPSNVQTEAYLEKRALQDGLDADDVYLGARRFSSIITTYGSTPGDFWDNAQTLLAAFHPVLAFDADTAAKGFLPFDFSQPTGDISTWPTSTYPDGIPLRYYLRPLAPPTYDLERTKMVGDALSLDFNIEMIARDPRKYLQTTVSVSMPTATTFLTGYRGDYPTWPVVTFALSATGHSAYTLRLNQQSIIIDLSGHTSGTFVLDTSTRRLTRNDEAADDLITSGAYAPLEHNAAYRHIDPTGISSATMEYREAWV